MGGKTGIQWTDATWNPDRRMLTKIKKNIPEIILAS
jgi:protein gp37